MLTPFSKSSYCLSHVIRFAHVLTHKALINQGLGVSNLEHLNKIVGLKVKLRQNPAQPCFHVLFKVS